MWPHPSRKSRGRRPTTSLETGFTTLEYTLYYGQLFCSPTLSYLCRIRSEARLHPPILSLEVLQAPSSNPRDVWKVRVQLTARVRTGPTRGKKAFCFRLSAEFNGKRWFLNPASCERVWILDYPLSSHPSWRPTCRRPWAEPGENVMHRTLRTCRASNIGLSRRASSSPRSFSPRKLLPSSPLLKLGTFRHIRFLSCNFLFSSSAGRLAPPRSVHPPLDVYHTTGGLRVGNNHLPRRRPPFLHHTTPPPEMRLSPEVEKSLLAQGADTGEHIGVHLPSLNAVNLS